jgi:hypothetical protein
VPQATQVGAFFFMIWQLTDNGGYPKGTPFGYSNPQKKEA